MIYDMQYLYIYIHVYYLKDFSYMYINIYVYYNDDDYIINKFDISFEINMIFNLKLVISLYSSLYIDEVCIHNIELYIIYISIKKNALNLLLSICKLYIL